MSARYSSLGVGSMNRTRHNPGGLKGPACRLGARRSIEAAPFVARVKLDDAALADNLPAGSTGTAAIFTDRVRVAHMIRKVLLRQIAITNYVNPF